MPTEATFWIVTSFDVIPNLSLIVALKTWIDSIPCEYSRVLQVISFFALLLLLISSKLPIFPFIFVVFLPFVAYLLCLALIGIAEFFQAQVYSALTFGFLSNFSTCIAPPSYYSTLFSLALLSKVFFFRPRSISASAYQRFLSTLGIISLPPSKAIFD